MKKKIFLFLIIFVIFAALLAISKGPYYVESKKCVGCGDCENICPTSAITILDGRSVIDPELCIECDICVKVCTYDAIRKAQ